MLEGRNFVQTCRETITSIRCLWPGDCMTLFIIFNTFGLKTPALDWISFGQKSDKKAADSLEKSKSWEHRDTFSFCQSGVDFASITTQLRSIPPRTGIKMPHSAFEEALDKNLRAEYERGHQVDAARFAELLDLSAGNSNPGLVFGVRCWHKPSSNRYRSYCSYC